MKTTNARMYRGEPTPTLISTHDLLIYVQAPAPPVSRTCSLSKASLLRNFAPWSKSLTKNLDCRTQHGYRPLQCHLHVRGAGHHDVEAYCADSQAAQERQGASVTRTICRGHGRRRDGVLPAASSSDEAQGVGEGRRSGTLASRPLTDARTDRLPRLAVVVRRPGNSPLRGEFSSRDVCGYLC